MAHHYIRDYIHAFAFLFLFLNACAVAVALRLNRGRVLVYNLGFVFGALGLFELYLATVPKVSQEGTYSEGGFYVGDADLGYGISPQSRIWTSILKAPDGSIIYDVKYSINQYGLRQGSPPLKLASQYKDKAIFFFGDSYTFGLGVNDEDTLPQQPPPRGH